MYEEQAEETSDSKEEESTEESKDDEEEEEEEEEDDEEEIVDPKETLEEGSSIPIMTPPSAGDLHVIRDERFCQTARPPFTRRISNHTDGRSAN